ncbi:MAG: hypothetical protein HY901_34810 [Deltaproteobacteria bacterium]|nr:hypothetical protein [Deltaproteobacteria bacterium]
MAACHEPQGRRRVDHEALWASLHDRGEFPRREGLALRPWRPVRGHRSGYRRRGRARPAPPSPPRRWGSRLLQRPQRQRVLAQAREQGGDVHVLAPVGAVDRHEGAHRGVHFAGARRRPLRSADVHRLAGCEEPDRRHRLGQLEHSQRFLAERGYDPVFGARPLKRAIQRYVQDPLAMKLLGGEISPGDAIVGEVPKGADELVFSRKSKPEAFQRAASELH